jgi:hypothetical protein
MRHIHERMVNDMNWWPNMNRVIAYSISRKRGHLCFAFEQVREMGERCEG